MKSLLISLLIVAVLLVLYLRPWGRGDSAKSPPSDRFMKQCAMVFSERPRSEDYCRCLWSRGVRNPGETLMTPVGRSAAEACGQGAP